MDRDTLRELALSYARKRGVPEDMFLNLVNTESGWNPNAVSPAGAQGLTQVMPATARQPGFGVDPLEDPYDVDENLRFGADYLAAMLDRYDDDREKAAIAYNAGPGVADAFTGDRSTLPQETQDYIPKVAGGFGGFGGVGLGAGLGAFDIGGSGAEGEDDYVPSLLEEGMGWFAGTRLGDKLGLEPEKMRYGSVEDRSNAAMKLSGLGRMLGGIL